MSRFVATTYSALFLLVAAWAWWTEASLGDSGGEHLLPGIALAFVGLPLSKLFEPLLDVTSPIFARRSVQLLYFTCCALAQALLLWWLAHRLNRKRVGEPNYRLERP